jgi:fluoride ion exporter CrcB/FEX
MLGPRRMVGPEFLAGIHGGFTTSSAVSLDAALLNERGQPWLAAASVAASVLPSIGGLSVMAPWEQPAGSPTVT